MLTTIVDHNDIRLRSMESPLKLNSYAALAGRQRALRPRTASAPAMPTRARARVTKADAPRAAHRPPRPWPWTPAAPDASPRLQNLGPVGGEDFLSFF